MRLMFPNNANSRLNENNIPHTALPRLLTAEESSPFVETKGPRIQGCTKFPKNQSFGPEIKELASLKQLLFLSVCHIDFLREFAEALAGCIIPQRYKKVSL